MNIHFLNSKQKKKLITRLEQYYGITKIPYTLLETGKKRIRAFSGSLTKEEISDLNKIANIELIGAYMISQKDTEPRISFDALTLIQNQITKNIIEINESQLNGWLRGHDLDIKTERGPVVLKYKDDVVGIGKSNTEKIFNYVPKERKLKTPLPKN